MRTILLSLVLAACATDELIDDEVEVAPEDDGKADADSELRVRTGDTTVWVTRTLARRTTENGPAFVLHGHTSRNLTEGRGFVLDDVYGDFAIDGARTFEVGFPVSTARTLVDGADELVELAFVPSHGRPDALTARVVVRPRFATFSGSSSVYLTAELTPVVVAGEVVYRAKGKTRAQNFVLTSRVAGVPHAVRRLDDTQFELDLTPAEAFAIAGVAGESVEISASLQSGNVVKTATLGVALKKLSLTAGDPEARFPRPDCGPTTESCLTGLPDGALDLASCGEAVVVLSCAGKLGVITDDVTVQAAIAHGNQLANTTSFRTDAAGLVGGDRVEQLVGGAEQTIDDRASHVFGRWFVSATARDTTLTGAVDGAILAAYAHPLDLVEPHAPVPGNDAATRQVAADALLVELAKQDFVATEFGRSYDDLVRAFRDTHVASIRELRETATVEPYPGMPGVDVVVGQWLGAYIEVSISHATGQATDTLIEID